MKQLMIAAIAVAFILLAALPSHAQQTLPGVGPAQDGVPFNIPFLDLTVRPPEGNEEVALSIQLLLLLTVLSIVPSFLILMTAFVRIAIVFDFVKRALSLQQVPPNQVLMGVALFLTLFIMWPTFTLIYEQGFQPFAQGQIGLEELYDRSISPLRVFMFRQMQNDPDTIRLMMRLQNLPRPNNLADVPTHVLIPAFALHEMTVAFQIGILLFIPFIIIDMVVASTLMSMGMIMVPPILISMPFKLILFILIDGWGLLTQQLVAGFL